jgi:hypothetical protein
MGNLRNFRFILAPSVLIGVLLLVRVFECSLVNDLRRLEGVLTVLAGIVAASIVPVGFVIGGFTNWLLTRIAKRWPHKLGHGGRYDLLVGEDVIARACRDLGIAVVPSDGDGQLNAIRTFVYSSRVPTRIADYLDRLWDASMAYAQSIVILIFAPALAIVFMGIRPSDAAAWWFFAVVAAGILFCWSCKSARAEIARIVTFAVDHPQ